MKRFYAIAAIGVLTSCLAGLAALAWAEPSTGQAAAKSEALPAVGSVVPAVPAAPSPGIEQTAATVPTPAPKPATAAGTPPAAPMPMPGPVPLGLPIMPAPKSLPGPVPAPPNGGQSGVVLPESSPVSPTTPSKFGAPPAFPVVNPATVAPVDDGKPVDPTQTNENTTGRQEPAVSIEWIGPATAKVGVAGDYSVVVRNACNIPVQQVLVRVRIPAGVTVAATEPKGTTENNVLIYELGTMAPKQEKNLVIRMVAEARGDISPQAWVTFTGSSIARIKVREPKLVLKAASNEKVLVGDAANFTLTVTNPGDGAAEQVKLHALLSDGLEHARGNKVDFDIGNLAAGETRSVQLVCGTKVGGMQKCEALAEAEGGLIAKDMASVNVIMPRLDLVMNGPALRYLERKAVYTLKVTNPGDAPASNVTVGDVVPAGFKVLAASDGGRHDFSTRTVSWFLGEIGPGQSKEVKLEVQAINIGEHKHKASAVAARGLRAETEAGTRVEGLSALLVEMIDTEDPIEVNGETAYEVRITNTGSKTETDIKLIATVPDKMEYKNSQGPTKAREEAGRTIVFEPIDKLAPRADAIYRITVKCLEPGTVRFKIQLTSTNLVEPVIKMEATRIYSDAPETKQP